MGFIVSLERSMESESFDYRSLSPFIRQTNHREKTSFRCKKSDNYFSIEKAIYVLIKRSIPFTQEEYSF